MKAKRIISMLLAVLMLAICASGCGTKNDGEVPTLTWVLPVSTQKDAAMVEEKINEIIEPEIGAKLKFVYIDSGSFQERLSMMMASGDDFDLCFTGYCNPYLNAVSLGGFTDLTDYIEEMPDLKAALPDYVWQAAKVDGRIYAVPNQQTFAAWTCPAVVKEMAEKYDFDPQAVKSTDDMESFLASVRDNESGYYPYDISFTDFMGTGYEQIKTGLYIKLDDPKCKVYKAYEIPEWLDAVNKVREWYKQGYIRKDVASASSTDATKPYAIFPITNKPGAESNYAKDHDGTEIEIIPMGEPVLTGGAVLLAMTAVGGNSKHPDLAVKLIEMANTNKELHRLITHGIEGVHYDLVDDIHIKVKNQDGYDMSTRGWMVGNDFDSYIIEGRDADVWEKTKELNDTAKKSPLLGFVFDDSNFVAELSNMDAVFSEYASLRNGTCDDVDKTLEEFKAKMEQAGISNVQKELQKQIDEFLKNK